MNTEMKHQWKKQSDVNKFDNLKSHGLQSMAKHRLENYYYYFFFFSTRFCMVAGKRMVDDARREIFVNSELAYYFYHQSEDPCRPRQFLEL